MTEAQVADLLSVIDEIYELQQSTNELLQSIAGGLYVIVGVLIGLALIMILVVILNDI